MLFNEKLNEIGKKLSPEFDQLFKKVCSNQSHGGDLLLIQENGLYNSEVHSWNNFKEKMSPYMIGPGFDRLSYNTHYEFIHSYRTTSVANIKIDDYKKELEYNPEKSKEIDKIKEFEGQSIQFEMLIYLKIWEADFFIKTFYQIARLLNSEPYDWHFKVAESSRDSGAIGNRHEIIRKKIRNRFKEEFPIIFDAFKLAYNTQIRNSIAHSKYSILSRSIRLNNYINEDPASQLQSISFDDWIELFHTTLSIYNEHIGFINKSKKHYSEIAKKNNNIIQVRINRKDPEERIEYHNLEYKEFSDGFGRWSWFRPK